MNKNNDTNQSDETSGDDSMENKMRRMKIPAPNFSRIPVLPPVDADYHDGVDCPPKTRDNPLYLALPKMRTEKEVMALMQARNPVFDPTVRSLSVKARLQRVDDVNDCFFAMPRHVALEDMLMTTIRNSFADRPWYNGSMEDAAARARRLFLGTRTNSSVGSGCFLSDIGQGKSEAILQILLACPQINLHGMFRGVRIGVQQAVWIYLSMPPKANALALLAWIAAVLDRMFPGEDLQAQVLKSRSNLTVRAQLVAQALAAHAVGTLVIDELQNMSVGNKTDKDTFANVLQELVNTTHTRIIFVGTPKSFNDIESEALKRRMYGERGNLVWRPLEIDADYLALIRPMWVWQPTKMETKLTDELIECTHRLVGGTPGYLKQLITAALATIIGHPKHPDEKLTPALFEHVMRTNFEDRYITIQAERQRRERIMQLAAQEKRRKEKEAAAEAAAKKAAAKNPPTEDPKPTNPDAASVPDPAPTPKPSAPKSRDDGPEPTKFDASGLLP